ncbi:MAG TPA: alpha/beta hydrolase [Acidimicrobiales bacterium]|nr:alpha/beta hydrolase [Acidimicrobiales bacterium]
MVTTELVQTHVGKVQVRRGGSGAPVVYLHSATGEGEGLQLLDQLAESFDLIAPMFPGYGESEGIEQIDDMEDAVFHLLDLFDQLGLTSPAVVGMSLGGWMAAELATRYPERVSKLVLVNPAGLYIKGAEIKDIFGRTPDEMAEDMFADQSQPMAQMMKAMGGVAMDEIPFEMIKPFYQTMSATARLAWDPYLHDPKLCKRLHRVTAPTLVVHGTQDTLIPRAHAETYAAEIPGARLVDVDNAAHLLAIEKPAELAELIRQHLQ